MLSSVTVAVLALLGVYVLKVYRQFAKNLAEAKASGIPYVIVPFFLANRAIQILFIVLLPILRALPTAWTDIWLDLSLEWGWKRQYEPFHRLGTDTFLCVTPERIVLNTAEASVINQMTNRRNDFPKALEVYESLKIYGSNVVVTEGQEWRHHRKIVSPPFTEKNNHLVWSETLSQSQAMVSSWFDAGSDVSKSIRGLADDAMRLSLHVISKAGFGVSLSWPGAEGATDSEGKDGIGSSGPGKGHTMTYTDALSSLLHNILWLLIFPEWLLKILPVEAAKTSHESFVEWGKYMREMFEAKKDEVFTGKESDTMDLMLAMLKGAGVTSQPDGEKNSGGSKQTLTDEEILGNAFVFILAGHETTANSIHFTLVYLALNVASQRHLQTDLDDTFQGRPVNEWDYDRHVPRLFGSMAGAVMNEQLRLLPPVVAIPKCTAKASPQPLTVGGKKCLVPANTYIGIITTAAHRNPGQWPSGPPKDPKNPSHPLSNLDNDLEEFKPERWLLDSDAKQGGAPEETEETNESATLGVNTAPDVSANLYKPDKGAYIPFSEGYRSCIGRRFAQVELLAVMAFIFSQYSVELDVKEWASDEELAKMDPIGKREVWEKAKVKVDAQMRDDMHSVITLQLRKGFIPLRLVKRGQEVFDYR